MPHQVRAVTTTAPRPERSSATDEMLALLMGELQKARADWAAERGEARHGGSPAESPARARLLAALEAYAAALDSRHLPLPPSIRDELRLRRGVRGDHNHRPF